MIGFLAFILMSSPLLQLLEETGVAHDGTFPSIVEETQKKWRRPQGKERWEISDLPEEKRETVLNLADQLGFIQQVDPTQKEYDYAFLLGGTVSRMEKRIDYLTGLWKSGLKIRKVVVLTGERPLDPRVEREIAKTEAAAMRVLWEKSELKSLPVEFVEVPMQGEVRPNTYDTYVAWLNRRPKPGTCLLISNQPFCLYQHAAAIRTLPPEFVCETVGEGADRKTLNAAVVLDAIAGWLFFYSS